MQEDAIRWNKRHSDGFMPKQPSDILHTYQPLLESYVQKGSAQALDIACGNGRNAKFLAALGFEVLGVDISQVALDSLQGMEHITTLCVDLDSFDIAKQIYDVVLNFYFLDRRLFAGIKHGVKSGGLVIFETFCAIPKIYDKDIFCEFSAQRSLKHAELQKVFRGWNIIYNALNPLYRSASESAKSVYLTQTFIAQKP